MTKVIKLNSDESAGVAIVTNSMKDHTQ